MRSQAIAVLAMLSVLLAAETSFGYYSQSLGRWTSEDPLGIDPAGALSGNPPSVRSQYADGLCLYGYAWSVPTTCVDPLGLWHYEKNDTARAYERTTMVLADPGEMQNEWAKTQLSQFMHLQYDEFDRWAEPVQSRCGYKVPNTVLAYWAGEMGGFGKKWVNWDREILFLKSKGYYIDEQSGLTGDALSAYLASGTQSRELYGLLFWGHGLWSKFNEPWSAFDPFDMERKRTWIGLKTNEGGGPLEGSLYNDWRLSYKLGLGIIYACGSDTARTFFSYDAVFWGSPQVLVPVGTPSVEDIYNIEN